MQLPKAYSVRGANMGRPALHNEEIRHYLIPGRFEVTRLAWVDGDYDSGGAYWGHVAGEYIYRAWCEDHGIEMWVRAKDDKGAQALVLAEYPGATFTMMDPEDAPLEPGTKTYWGSTGSGTIEIELTREDVERASHSGDCSADVEELRKVPRIARQLEKIDQLDLIAELRDYGTWSDEELMDHEMNLSRILWLLAGDIKDSAEYGTNE